jgi:hypothetical protein
MKYAALACALVVVFGAAPADGHAVACASGPFAGSLDGFDDDLPRSLIGIQQPLTEEWKPLTDTCMDKSRFEEIGVGTIAWTGSLMLAREGADSRLSRGAFHPRKLPFPSLTGGARARRVDIGNALAH